MKIRLQYKQTTCKQFVHLIFNLFKTFHLEDLTNNYFLLPGVLQHCGLSAQFIIVWPMSSAYESEAAAKEDRPNAYLYDPWGCQGRVSLSARVWLDCTCIWTRFSDRRSKRHGKKELGRWMETVMPNRLGFGEKWISQRCLIFRCFRRKCGSVRVFEGKAV